MNLHTLPRTFYFTRHGQSEYNRQGKIGGDSSLSKAGVEYAERLAKYAREHVCVGSRGSVPARLWTSTLKRTKETARFIEHPKIKVQGEDGEHEWEQLRCVERRNLDELYAGKCDGMTYKEIEETFPNEFEARQEDKLAYRYPRGESYMDVILRLEPLAHEMERTREPILIIGHQGILRILYAYFMGLSRSEAPYVSIPLNHVLKLTPHAYGCNEEKVSLMTKEDMKNCGDGQDEPVTSMPLKDPNKVGVVKPKVDALATAVPAEHVSAAGEKEKVDEDKAGVARGVATSASFRRFESENTSGGKVREEDPVLDVPSC
jgi:broad specificity phosphatase PhoE